MNEFYSMKDNCLKINLSNRLNGPRNITLNNMLNYWFSECDTVLCINGYEINRRLIRVFSSSNKYEDLVESLGKNNYIDIANNILCQYFDNPTNEEKNLIKSFVTKKKPKIFFTE